MYRAHWTWQESLTFAPRRAEAEEVDLAALALQAGDAGLTLALPRHDVTLAVGGADGVAVAAVEHGDTVSGGGRVHTISVLWTGREGRGGDLSRWVSAGLYVSLTTLQSFKQKQRWLAEEKCDTDRLQPAPLRRSKKPGSQVPQSRPATLGRHGHRPVTWEQLVSPPKVPSGEQAHAGREKSRRSFDSAPLGKYTAS